MASATNKSTSSTDNSPSSATSNLSASILPSTNVLPTNTSTQLVTINAAAQLPIKLTSTNFPSWRCQFNSILLGYNLSGFINGSFSCPAAFISNPDSTTTPPEMISNPAYEHWIRQDQLLLHGIISSTTESVVPFIASAQTSKQAWEKLQSLYANKSRSRMMNLKEKLTKPKGTRTISEFLQSLRSTADELALINSLVNEDDLVIHALNGIGSEFKEISAALKARESPMSFEELLEKLTDYEESIKQHHYTNDIVIPSAHLANRSSSILGESVKQTRLPSASAPKSYNGSYQKRPSLGHPSFSRVICQYCDKPGHSAKSCFKLKPKYTSPMAHHVSSSNSAPTWLVDSGASHHVTSDLKNLNISTHYGGPETLHIGDGSGLDITHTGSTSLHSSSTTL